MQSRHYVLKLREFLSLSWKKKKKTKNCRGVQFLFFPHQHAVWMCVGSMSKSLRHVRVEERHCGEAFHADWILEEFWIFLPTWLQFAGAGTAGQAARITGLSHNLSVAPPIQTQVHKISPFSAFLGKHGEILRSKNTHKATEKQRNSRPWISF